MNSLDLVLMAWLLGFPLAKHFLPYVKPWPDLTDTLQALAYVHAWIFYGDLGGMPNFLGKENAE
jgi:hypothetical protein